MKSNRFIVSTIGFVARIGHTHKPLVLPL